jgi:hypothetical protein
MIPEANKTPDRINASAEREGQALRYAETRA